jgi:hypothetical protein
LLGVTEIPIALFFTGERTGNYRVKPPLLDMAWMQIELYRAMSRNDQILTLAGSPMLVAKGMNPLQPTQVTDAEAGRSTYRATERLIHRTATSGLGLNDEDVLDGGHQDGERNAALGPSEIYRSFNRRNSHPYLWSAD